VLVSRSSSSPAVAMAADRTPPLPLHILLLVAAVAAGIAAQGGFYPSGRLLVAVLTGAALVVSLRDQRGLPPAAWPVLAAGGGLAGWALARAASGGSAGAGLPLAVTLACLVAGMLVVQYAGAAQRELCAVSAVGAGVLVAVTGWLGVAWRLEPLALATDRRLWRVTSTLTYANAAAALIAMLGVLAVALLLARPSSPVRAGAVYLLLAGLGATLSRGGAIALLVGLVALAALAGVRATARLVAAPVLGAALAVAALAPSFPVTSRAQPVLAVGGLVAGLLIALGVPRLPGRIRLAALLALTAGALAGAALMAGTGRGLGVLTDSRATLASPTRLESVRAALCLAADHPFAGVGPGRATFTWAGTDGQLLAGRYAHNEYLQVLVELGAVGLALLLVLLATIAHVVRRGRTGASPALLWSGATAALLTLLVHSGLDFLWQLPVVPLTGALLVGLAAPYSRAAAALSSVEEVK
jgi:O-Antigen ligase